ncbi:carboxylesterase [Colletotrichum phormii]|uniref:Carboxylesterase n=1 Tax=Colletotrichum phormii TaxID=359342 RepID=A0AAJ0EG66_9PEZI|nr:carboxylesterase [Colletotrichum phormii]KAK1637793.1 carboxylesterase [Colletotrichum phormii]
MRIHSRIQLAVPLLATAASAAEGPIVDLKYARYQGTFNLTSNLNIFRGHSNRRPPLETPPRTNIQRHQLKQRRPDPSHSKPASMPVGPPLPPISQNSSRGSLSPELRLRRRRGLPLPKRLCSSRRRGAARVTPVVVWIHGGGYSLDSASSFDFFSQITTNNNTYVAVIIQYRLGAFGFLPSEELVQGGGVANAGLWDMVRALRWVKTHVGKFGGDPRKVTVAGQSVGAGGALLLAESDEAVGLFDGVIASSPYLTTLPKHDGDRPTRAYKSLVERIGCSTNTTSPSLLSCLQKADSLTLQNASDWVSTQGRYGQWEWWPIIDGKLVRETLTQELSWGKAGVNGRRVLTSNVADEGPYFTWQNITTQAHFVSFVESNFPALSAGNVSEVLATYAQKHEAFLIANSRDANNTEPGFSTDGLESPYATTVSDYATGWQQVANNFYAEATFVCPSHWLANAYAAKEGAKAWRYQYSVPPAYHGVDVGSGSDFDVLLAPVDTPGTAVTMPLRRALQNAWGQFITRGEELVLGEGGGNATVWQQCKVGGRVVASMLNANMTGGVPVGKVSSFDGMVSLNITSYAPGDAGISPLEAVLKVVDGDK